MQHNNPIDINNLLEAAYVKKPHGVNGQMLIIFNQGIEIDEESAEYLFIETEGLPVPFNVEQFEWRDDQSALIKLRFIDNKEQAQSYTGYKCFFEQINLADSNNELNIFMLKGYRLFDTNNQFIGTIEQIDDFGGNLVFTLNSNNNEIMIPYHPDLMHTFSPNNKTICMEIPEGLLE
ncbi:MAG: hypothetical protein JW735_10090 [Prolixibacteraceae bacterium]|nr:hypothetical protein [Prolixibacteraceae bacterium]